MSITEVAKLAGVSSSTVSRVINSHPRVASETVQAVRAAMAKLDYTPSDRRPGPKPGMAGQRKGLTLGVLVMGTSKDRTTPAFEELMRGVANGAATHNLKLNFHHIADPDDLPAAILNGGVDGLLLHGALPSAKTREKLLRYPCVWLMGNRRRPDFGDQVMPDTYDIGEKAAHYLLQRGHKSMAFLNLDHGHWPFRVTSQSFAGHVADALATCHVLERARSDDERAYWPQHAIGAAEELVAEYLKIDSRPTGIFMADDMQAAILQPALQRAGVKIGPGKVEVISCNNERPYLIGLTPKPAEIDIRVETIGLRGVERLAWRLENRDVPERMVVAIEPLLLDPEGQPVVLDVAGR